TVWSFAAILHGWSVGLGGIMSPMVGPLVNGVVAGFNAISSLVGAAPWTVTLSASVVGFMVARFLLGIGEAGSFPASIKTVAEWFPKKERALATGIFNAGTNVGAIIAPATALVLSAKFGWQSAFLFTGAVGFLWLIFWLVFYQKPEEHARLSAEEFKHVRDGEAPETAEKTPWLRL